MATSSRPGRIHPGLATLGACLLLSASWVEAQRIYTYTKIAPPLGSEPAPGIEWGIRPSLNNDGVVALSARENIFGTLWIMIGDGGPVSIINQVNGTPLFSFRLPSINSQGDVAYSEETTGRGPIGDVPAPTIFPTTVDLAAPPLTFPITGHGFADLGTGLPVANFHQNGELVGQARATGLNSEGTSLSVPWPTSATALPCTPLVSGLKEGPATVTMFNQTDAACAPSSFALVGSTQLTVADSRPTPGLDGITPARVDMANLSVNLTIAGHGFRNVQLPGSSGLTAPVVRFVRDGRLLAQQRATLVIPVETTTLTVAVPHDISGSPCTGPLPLLSTGPVTVQVYNQVGVGCAASSFSLIGSIGLMVTNTSVSSIENGIFKSIIDSQGHRILARIANAPALVNVTGLPAIDPPPRLDIFGNFVSINDAGTVLFFATGHSPDGLSAYFLDTVAGTPNLVAVSGRRTTLLEAHLNNNGKVAYKVMNHEVGPVGFKQDSEEIVIVTPGPAPHHQLIAKTGEVFAAFGSGISINDSDTVAFIGTRTRPSGEKRVLKGFASPHLATVATSIGRFNSFEGVSINASGTVAFGAFLDDGGGNGIFTGPHPVFDRVVGTGDRIGDRTVSRVSLGPEGLNDRGQIAFSVVFTDNSTAIVRADPLGPLSPGLHPPNRAEVMQLTTGGGTAAGLSQSVPTPSPLGIVNLVVDLKFLAPTGGVVVKIFDEEVYRIAAPSSLTDEFRKVTIPIDLSGKFSARDFSRGLPLLIELNGSPGSTVQINKVDLPGLTNGDFERGDLYGWIVDTSRGGAATVVAAFPPAAR